MDIVLLIIEMQLQSKAAGRVPTLKPWNISPFFNAWKVLENCFGPGKLWKLGVEGP